MDLSKKRTIFAKETPAPYSHNLINLAQSCGLGQLLSDEQKAGDAAMGKNEVIDIVRRYKDMVVAAVGPAEVYLYGSYSTGKAHKDSDIDVAVVVPEVKEDFLKISSLLWSLTWDINTLIEPILIDARYPSPLFQDVLSTGVAV